MPNPNPRAFTDFIDGQESMRSIADALDALRAAGWTHNASHLRMRIVSLNLAGGDVMHFAVVCLHPNELNHPVGVTLPTADRFRGRRIESGETETRDIRELDGATVWSTGAVQNLDGYCFEAVEMIPRHFVRELNPLQKLILYWTIRMLGLTAKDVCYQLPDDIRHFLPKGFGKLTADLRYLDYGRLRGRKLPSLKAIHRYLGDRNKSLREVSHQTIANALRLSGLRVPRSGRLARR
jgi:hypothetical protein